MDCLELSQSEQQQLSANGNRSVQEIFSGRDVLQFLCMESNRLDSHKRINMPTDPFLRLLERSISEETNLSPQKQSSSSTTFFSSPTKKRRKLYKPSRVTHSFENSFEKDGCSGSPAFVNDKCFLSDEKIMSFLPRLESNIEYLEQDVLMKHKTEATIIQNPVVEIKKYNGMMDRSKSPVRKATPTGKKTLNGTHGREYEDQTYTHKSAKKFATPLFRVCSNVACKADLSAEDSFCKRCSCCICKHFDDNKDPSLWIECCTEDGGCGYSCHAECALKEHFAGTVKANGCSPSLDGSYFCQFCGRISPLISFWKRQLSIAKVARRVDVLKYRLNLSHRLFMGSKIYEAAQGCVDEAVRKLEAEVNKMGAGQTRLGRCIVNRLGCNAEVQKLMNLALEKVNSAHLDALEGYKSGSCIIHFEDVSSSSIVISINDDTIRKESNIMGYKLWHKPANEPVYALIPTCTISSARDKFLVSNLHPLTEYTFKVVPFTVEGDLVYTEAGCSTKGVEIKLPVKICSSVDVVLVNSTKSRDGASRCVNGVFDFDLNTLACDGVDIESCDSLEELNDQKLHPTDVPESIEFEITADSCRNMNIGRPCACHEVQDEDELENNQMHISDVKIKKKQLMLIDSVPCFSSAYVSSASANHVTYEAEFHNFECCVKVIRWLERGGHIEEEFRMKFFTWLTFNANEHERRVVSVYIDTFKDDPASLAGQLIHTFEDKIMTRKN